ncbi:hypothetical protein LTR64_005402 [Lithohypha guttulata]|uniref:uncharacterized protein n=1 Tax=Lithohypha guttulata TaxID=1690604 RepID=UPI002DDDF4AB|nr:hypothetical protein LTR51_002805 [Lithohypha guttulata]
MNHSLSSLRAVANRLISTSGDQLPRQVGYLASTIANCSDALQVSSSSSDQSIIIHKLKTKTSALLQDRTPEGRFCGIVIARALIEAGGATFLSECGSWVRNLISCLNKPDPPEIKLICVSVITRVYLLTVRHQALVRDVTTPTLPAYITASISATKPSTSSSDGKIVKSLSSVLVAVLKSWQALIKHFASTIRPNIASIKLICLSLLSDESAGQEVQIAARDVLASLHFCAPKNNMAVEWSHICSQTIEAAHDTADLLLRAVVEDWTPVSSRISKSTRKQKTTSTPTTNAPDVLGLDKWTGVAEGTERLCAQVSLLRAILTNQYAQEATIPLTSIVDLTARLAAVTVPTAKSALRFNNEITREEREELWTNLPRVHVQVLELLQALVSAFGQALYPVTPILYSQMWNIFSSEGFDNNVREAFYRLFAAFMHRDISHFIKADSANIRRLIHYCCNDLSIGAGLKDSNTAIPADGDTNNKSGSSAVALTMNMLGPVKSRTLNLPSNSKQFRAAYDLLPILLAHLPSHKLTGSSTLRASLDSTSVLLQHHEAMLASVLYPLRPQQDSVSGKLADHQSSLLPFLARSAEIKNSISARDQMSLEGLLRPRMPLIGTLVDGNDPMNDAEDDEMEEDEDENDNMVFEKSENGVNVADSVSQDENQSQNNVDVHPQSDAAHSNIQAYAGAQKRDFTTLLEQSADAQLAASAASISEAPPMSLDEPANNTSTSKRQRVGGGPIHEPNETVSSTLTTATALQIPEMPDTQTTLPQTSDEGIVSPADNLSTRQEPKGKEKAADYGSDDDSSDFEIPPIDATLNTFSDSEDDDDEEDD